MTRARPRRRVRPKRHSQAVGPRRVIVGAVTIVVAAAAGVALLVWITRPPPRQAFRFPAASGITQTPGDTGLQADRPNGTSDVAPVAR